MRSGSGGERCTEPGEPQKRMQVCPHESGKKFNEGKAGRPSLKLGVFGFLQSTVRSAREGGYDCHPADWPAWLPVDVNVAEFFAAAPANHLALHSANSARVLIKRGTLVVVVRKLDPCAFR